MVSAICDMSGTAAVTAATQAIAVFGLSVKVATRVTMTENLPSSTAYHSADMLTMFDGTIVGDASTDVRGRLVMADALRRVGTDSPNLTMDVAALAGACVVTLGKHTIGLMTDNDVTADRPLDAAKAAREDSWCLPVTDGIHEGPKSGIASLWSSGKNHYGGALIAVAFLQYSIPEGISWVYLDIVGPA